VEKEQNKSDEKKITSFVFIKYKIKEKTRKYIGQKNLRVYK